MKTKFLITLFFFICLGRIQSKDFSSFKLLYDIPQQVSFNGWPIYSLNTTHVYNDTLFTLLVKEEFITSIPLLHKEKIQNIKIPFNAKDYITSFKRINNCWYFLSSIKGLNYLNKSSEYCNLIQCPSGTRGNNFFFVNHNFVIYYQNSKGETESVLYNPKGDLLSKLQETYLDIGNVYQDKIFNEYSLVYIEKDIIKTSSPYKYSGKYKDANTFVGGYKNFGYFIDWFNQNYILIRNMENMEKEEYIKLPIRFKIEDLGVPEEGDINLRVFSNDNNIFYFVRLDHGHLKIYKAIR